MHFQDSAYLREQQYRNASNLDVRISLHQRYSTNPIGLHSWMFPLLQISPGGSILELGCGSGALWSANRSQIPDDLTAVLSDFSFGMLKDAQKNIGREERGFRYHVVDVRHIPYPDSRFDIVMAHFMLYHVAELDLAVAEMARVLRPGGLFFATTLGKDHLLEIGDLVRSFDPAKNFGRQDNSFSLENGRRVLDKFFDNVHVLEYKDSLHITDPEPLIAYIQSGTATARDLQEGQWLESFRIYVQEVFEQNAGALDVRKSVGMFAGVKR